MRKKLRIRLAVAVFVILAAFGAVIWWAIWFREPVYQGKPLTYWLRAYDWGPPDPAKPRPTRSQADAAVRAVGSNAIPTLLRLLEERDSPLKRQFIEWANRHHLDPEKLHLQYRSPGTGAHEAMHAFEVLGLQSENLMPKLTRIYESNTNSFTREHVVAITAFVVPHADDAAPLLLVALNDTNDFIIRANAAVALGKMRVPAKIAVPALIAALKDISELVQAEAAFSLAEYGAEARAAMPELEKIIEVEKKRPGHGPAYSQWFPGKQAWTFGWGNPGLPVFSTNKWMLFEPFQSDLYGAANYTLSNINEALSRKQLGTK